MNALLKRGIQALNFKLSEFVAADILCQAVRAVGVPIGISIETGADLKPPVGRCGPPLVGASEPVLPFDGCAPFHRQSCVIVRVRQVEHGVDAELGQFNPQQFFGLAKGAEPLRCNIAIPSNEVDHALGLPHQLLAGAQRFLCGFLAGNVLHHRNEIVWRPFGRAHQSNGELRPDAMTVFVYVALFQRVMAAAASQGLFQQLHIRARIFRKGDILKRQFAQLGVAVPDQLAERLVDGEQLAFEPHMGDACGGVFEGVEKTAATGGQLLGHFF